MQFTSTRDSGVRVSAAEAIARGISADGGLYVPTEVPKITKDEIISLIDKSYCERAETVLAKYLTDFTPDELKRCVIGAYGGGKFSSEKIAPLAELDSTASVLELWRGPTCAFKDMALQILPHLLTVSAKKIDDHRTIVILVATSGDTGKAALEGFSDVDNTKILVFFPSDGVSPMQKLQMTTQEGGNVGVCAIHGNFDDAQTGVKAIFTDPDIIKKLNENGMCFSSANSINWGRLVPQIVYYVSAYCDLIACGKIAYGDGINIVVPTGNFGNILAAYYAREMGVPIKKLVCASNANNVLTDFLNTGVYNRNRNFYTTMSPSMDILISSNLERLLFCMSGGDSSFVAECMKKLSETGKYSVGEEMMSKIKALFAAGFCDDSGTTSAIAETFKNNNYLCDTHTAVAVNVYRQYASATGDNTVTVIASTASPYKFCSSVLDAVGGEKLDDEFKMLSELERLTGTQCPPQLKNLQGKPVRFNNCCEREKMTQAVFDLLGID